MTEQSAVSPTAVVVLGTDTPIGLAVTRDLGRHGHRVVGIGRSREAIAGASRYCTHHAVRAAGGEEGLVTQILELAERHGVTCLLAISEVDLLMLNRHRDRLEAALKVLTPKADRLALVLDKSVGQAEAEAVGLKTPRTFSPKSLQQVRAVARELSYPVVLKWADPNAVAAVLAETGVPLLKTDFATTADQLLEKLARYEGVGAFPLVQQYCRGRGLGHMFLATDGEILLEFQHERLHEWPPEGGVSSLCRAVPLTEHRAALDGSRALIRRLKWTGVAMVEYRYDASAGTYSFMEVNGRFWGSLPLANACNIPFASGLVAACGQNLPVPPYQRDYPGLACLYGIPETKRLLRLLVRRGAISDPLYRPDAWSSLMSYVTRPFRPSTRYYVLQSADLGPWIRDVSNVAAAVFRRVLRR